MKPRKNDGMDRAFNRIHDAIVSALTWVLVGILALFSAAEWALRPRLIVATIASVLILSMTVIWAVSRANGM